MTTALPLLPLFTDDALRDAPKVAISACLYGEAVRYDGTTKTLEDALTLIGNRLELIAICPEVGAGMPVPRPPIQLVASDDGIRALGRDDPTIDVTTALDVFRRQSLQRCGQTLCGYIVKSRSPSCGLNTTAIFDRQGEQLRLGSGLQADYFHRQQPWLQMVDDDWLADAERCDQFIRRCQWLEDIRNHSVKGDLAALHQHYLPIITLMVEPHRRSIESALQSASPHRYWQAFGIGVQALGAGMSGS